MVDVLVTFGYMIASIGLFACAITYFALPMMMKVLFKTEEKED